jgi:hypothetical protein
MIREAEPEDLQAVLPIMKKIFDESIFKNCAFKGSEVQRAFAVIAAFDHGYAKVYEENGVIKGLLCGAVAANQWGVLCAQDTFFSSDGGTARLLKDFINWSKDMGAEFVQIAEFTGIERYQRLLELHGLKRSGSLYIGGL